MSAPNTIHYLNADFDLRLRAKSDWRDKKTLRRQVEELSWQALLGAREGDTVHLATSPPTEFVEHLEAVGLGGSKIQTDWDDAAAGEFAPYGWSDETIGLNLRLASPSEHPTLEILRRVNSRRFALELERSLGIDSAAGEMFHDLDGVERSLREKSAESEWLVKGQHGNSGLANRRITAPTLSDSDRKFISRALDEDGQLLLEGWCDRSRDWCIVFDVPFCRQSARIHEPFCTRDGALIGALFDPQLDAPSELYESAAAAAQQLEEAGYFGPVCVDAFHWRDGDVLKLREVVDLNCRQSMTTPAFGAWRRLAPTQALYYRFFNRKKLALPPTLATATEALGEHRFDRELGRGILFTSPLSCGKLSVMFIDSDRERIFALERWFRDRFEK